MSPRSSQVTVSGELGNLPQGIDAAVYRLAQESLTNALRHARGATRVLIEVVGEPDRVRLRVADDGEVDPAYAAAPGFGLIGMAERAQLLGGTLAAGPAPGGGWTVTAELPREAAVVSIRVVVADDQDLVRTGLSMILDAAEPASRWSARPPTALEAVELATRLRPDVLLVDIRMPRLDGIEVTRRLAGPGRGRPDGRRGDHDLRPRRVRPRGAARRRPGLPAQGRRAGPAGPGRARRGRR